MYVTLLTILFSSLCLVLLSDLIRRLPSVHTGKIVVNDPSAHVTRPHVHMHHPSHGKLDLVTRCKPPSSLRFITECQGQSTSSNFETCSTRNTMQYTGSRPQPQHSVLKASGSDPTMLSDNPLLVSPRLHHVGYRREAGQAGGAHATSSLSSVLLPSHAHHHAAHDLSGDPTRFPSSSVPHATSCVPHAHAMDSGSAPCAPPSWKKHGSMMPTHGRSGDHHTSSTLKTSSLTPSLFVEAASTCVPIGDSGTIANGAHEYEHSGIKQELAREKQPGDAHKDSHCSSKSNTLSHCSSSGNNKHTSFPSSSSSSSRSVFSSHHTPQARGMYRERTTQSTTEDRHLTSTQARGVIRQLDPGIPHTQQQQHDEERGVASAHRTAGGGERACTHEERGAATSACRYGRPTNHERSGVRPSAHAFGTSIGVRRDRGTSSSVCGYDDEDLTNLIPCFKRFKLKPSLAQFRLQSEQQDWLTQPRQDGGLQPKLPGHAPCIQSEQLKATWSCQIGSSADVAEFELSFQSNYPHAPPRIKQTRPSSPLPGMNYGEGGSLMLPFLTTENWRPVFDIAYCLERIQKTLGYHSVTDVVMDG